MADPTVVAQAQNESTMTAHAQALLANLKNSSQAKVAPRVFRSNIVTMRYVFKNGKVAPFLTKNGIDSEYATNIEHEIQELDAEIASNHPNISSKPAETVETLEPIEALKKKHFEEFKKMLASNTLKTNDAGTSEQGKLHVANSTTIGDGAAGSDSSVGNVNTTGAMSAVKISIK